MSTVSYEDIAHLSRLARLNLTDEEKERYAIQLSSVVGYVEQLQQVVTKEGVTTGITGLTNVLAADELRSEGDLAVLNPDVALSAAPLSDGSFIQVRAVLNTEEGAA